jgi:hypothetical protein
VNILLIFILIFTFLFFISRLLIKDLTFLSLRITNNRNLAIRLFHLIFLPGVIVHELAHLIVAEVLLVRTGGLNFSPQPGKDRIVLGSVGIEETDPFRRAIVGFAPVLVGFLIISFSVFYFLSDNSPLSFPVNYLFVFFVVFEVGNTMFSSKKDLEGTALLLFIMGAFVITLYFFGFQFPEWLSSLLESESFFFLLKKGIFALAFPIILDLLIIFLVRLTMRDGKLAV